jgi:hypothetical protein
MANRFKHIFNMTTALSIARRTAGVLGLTALLLASAPDASAQPKIRSFGFGIILGEPTGVTLKGSLSGSNAWDAGVASSFFGSIRLHGDYLWNVDAFNSSKAGLYFGLGPVIGIGRGKGVLVKGERSKWYYYEDENALALGVRVAAGINAMPFTAPVELFAEIAPILGLMPTSGLGWDGAVGIRFYP